MLIPALVEIRDGVASPGLRARVLAGDVVIVRRGLHHGDPRGPYPAWVDITGSLPVIRVEPPGAVK
jgi:hypothetical protein